MATRQYWVGSMGPFTIDDEVDTYPDGTPITSCFRAEGSMQFDGLVTNKLTVQSPDTVGKKGVFECSDTIWSFLAQGVAMIFGNDASYLQFYPGSGQPVYFDTSESVRFRNAVGGTEKARIDCANGFGYFAGLSVSGSMVVPHITPTAGNAQVVGLIGYDGGHFYGCTAVNVWKQLDN